MAVVAQESSIARQQLTPACKIGKAVKDIVPHFRTLILEISLAETLTAGGIDTLIITGVTTSGCIRATCVDAMSHGFAPIVVADACGDRHEAPHAANLFDMNAKYADVVDETAVTSYLNELAG